MKYLSNTNTIELWVCKVAIFCLLTWAYLLLHSTAHWIIHNLKRNLQFFEKKCSILTGFCCVFSVEPASHRPVSTTAPCGLTRHTSCLQRWTCAHGEHGASGYHGYIKHHRQDDAAWEYKPVFGQHIRKDRNGMHQFSGQCSSGERLKM